MLGNVAANDTDSRDDLLAAGIMATILKLMTPGHKVRLNLLQMLCWVVANLCKGSPYPHIDQVARLT